MKLHEDKILFADIIGRTALHPNHGGLGIRAQFIEKDYWISTALRNLSESPYVEHAVFKGGTSLSKAYQIGMRFSEDIDIAIVKNESISDAKLKTIIRSTEKAISKGLKEISHPQSSKGSRYRKSFYEYPLINESGPKSSIIPGQLLFEINSFANPVPYKKIQIRSFIHDYLY
ncbi:MAG: nucleotidyl transferase AbiEii/AbiGii toxin family protein [Lachnospiraceae bacterium]|nr:nucleotidyl transferase AbiEii/AbiGii toxin family protein [Lachnospiraceae bacterium]